MGKEAVLRRYFRYSEYKKGSICLLSYHLGLELLSVNIGSDIQYQCTMIKVLQ